MALLDDDLSQLATHFSDTFRITTSQKQDPTCITLLSWIRSADFPTCIEVKGLCPELRLLWHHRNNLSVDDNAVIWRQRSSQNHMLQLLVPKPACERLFLSYHASLFGGHLGRNRTFARLAHRHFIGRAYRMMSKNGLDNVPFALKESLRLDATTRRGTFLPGIGGTV